MPAKPGGGLFAGLGNFASTIYHSLQRFGGDIGDALGLGRQAGLSPSLEAVTREWGQVKVSGESEKVIAGLREYEYVPHDLYATTDIPLKRKFAYQVKVYGRDLETGRFTSQEWNLPVSRELTIEEIQDVARQRLGMAGVTPKVDIFNVKATAAWIRQGEEF